jgi:pSer/pThr/pTyr-binding forkhead associated (FHA) protein
MPKIIVTFKDKILREVVLAKEETTIGRDLGNDIQIDNPSVSRFHAKIYRQGWPFFVEDLKSTNGVLVNGLGVSWKTGLKNNDRITIGKHTLIFLVEKKDYDEAGQGTRGIDVNATIMVTPKAN